MDSKPVSQNNDPFDFGRLFRLARKELVEILRDRRTIITLVLMPILVYPLMGIVVQKLMLQTVTENVVTTYKIGFESEDLAKRFSEILNIGERVVVRRESENQGMPIPAEEQQPGENSIDVSVLEAKTKIEFFFADGASLDELVQTGVVDVGVQHDQDPELGNPAFALIHNPRFEYSHQALLYVGKRLRLANEDYVQKLLTMNNVQLQLPASFKERDIVSKAGPPALLTFVPLMLVLMTITGAVYPAIDLTAGERERGTMEILVAAPISRFVVLIGKFVAVVAVAILTAIANLVAMVVTVYSLGLDTVIFGEAGVSVSALAVIFLLLLVLAGFFSATLLCLTSFARSFKEAQAYLIPLMLVAFAPGLLSLTPNLETTNALAVVPLVNIVLVGRDLLAGNASTLLVIIAVVSTVIYGVLALSLAARVFGQDAILTGGNVGWRDVISFSKESRAVPDISTAMFFLAVLFPAFIVVSGLVANFGTKQNASIEQRLWANAMITVALFVGLPCLFAIFSQLRLRTTFYFNWPSWVYLISALLIGSSIWTLAYELEIVSLSSERVEKFIEIFESMKFDLNEVPLYVKLICLALVPAICEEITFRGFLLSSLSKRLNVTLSVTLTAVLFGLFHIFVRDALMFERMVPSTFMGIILGIVCVRTGSLLPGVVLHVVHNGLLISLAHYESYLNELGIGVANQEHLPLKWMLIALIPLAIGFLLLSFRKPKPLNQMK